MTPAYTEALKAIPLPLRLLLFVPPFLIFLVGLGVGGYSAWSLHQAGEGPFQWLIDFETSLSGGTYHPFFLFFFALLVVAGWAAVCMGPPYLVAFLLVRSKVFPPKGPAPADRPR